MGIPRLARLLIFSSLLITIPTLYLLYPHRETIIQTTQGYLEKGGIDSSHWRDPLPPPPELKVEHEEVRDWEGQDVIVAEPTDVKEGCFGRRSDHAKIGECNCQVSYPFCYL
jgi:hypothetical protein